MQVGEYNPLLVLAGDNVAVREGVIAIAADTMTYKYVQQAAKFLTRAKNDSYLRSVEASLQSMINMVQNKRAYNSPFMDEQRTKLYLYTLQNLIFNLSKWQFDNGKENHYVPDIMNRYQRIAREADSYNIDPNIIYRACHVSYGDFDFLDEKRLDSVAMNLHRYRAIVQEENTEKRFLGIQQINVVHEDILDKVINIVKQKLDTATLSFNYIVNNFDQFFNTVGQVITSKDRQAIAKVTTAIMKRVMAFGEIIDQGIQKLGEGATAILDKVTRIVKNKLGVAALSVQVIVNNWQNFFDAVREVVHVEDPGIVTRLTENIVQRLLGNEKKRKLYALQMQKTVRVSRNNLEI